MTLKVGVREALAAFLLALAWAFWVRPGPLSLPYFWDEGDVYAPGARWLAQHSFDIRPGHFPDDWSRGHPQLFYLVAAIAFRLFGSGPTCAHALMLPFTALALAATYVLGCQRHSRWLGVAAAAALASSPLFMSMGAFLLPEMPLTALTAFTLVCVQRTWWWRAAIACVLMVWIKETGVAVAIAIAAMHLVRIFLARDLREHQRAFAISLIPVAALVAFFVWQRLGAGYFVFPHHQHLFTDRPLSFANVLTVFPSVLLWDGRVVLCLAASAALLVLWQRKASLVFDPTAFVAIATLGFNAAFFTKMFWLERYALPVHPGIVVLLFALLLQAWPELTGHAHTRHGQMVFVSIVAFMCAIGISHFWKRGHAPEHSFVFAEDVQSHVQAIHRVAEQNPLAVLSTWPLTTEMREPWLGFSERAMNAFHLDAINQHPNIDAALIDVSSTQRERLRHVAREHGLHLQWLTTVRGGPAIEFWGQ